MSETRVGLELTAEEMNTGAVAYSNLGVSNFQTFGGDDTQLDVSDFASINVGNFSSAELGSNGNVSFGRQPGLSQFARGDSVLTGAIITGIPNIPVAANANAVAEVQLTDPGEGTSGGNVGTGTEFTFAWPTASPSILDSMPTHCSKSA